MSKALKVYSGCFDGTMNVVVATPTKGAAAVAFGVSRYSMDQYACDTGNAEEISVATSKPGAVFSRPNSLYSAPFVEGNARWRRGDPWPPA